MNKYTNNTSDTGLDLKHFFSEMLKRMDEIIECLKSKNHESSAKSFEDKDISIISSNKPEDEKKIINFIFE